MILQKLFLGEILLQVLMTLAIQQQQTFILETLVLNLQSKSSWKCLENMAH